jgi:hypothetical protein
MNQTTASAIGIYGASDTRKTSSINAFAQFVREMTGRDTRLLSSETAGADRVEPSIDAGILHPYWLFNDPRSAIRKFCRGEWPQIVQGKAAWVPTPAAEWAKIGGVAIEGTQSIAEQILRDLSKKGQKVKQDLAATYTEDGVVLGEVSPAHFGAAQQDVMFLLAESPRGLFQASGGLVQYVLWTGHEAKGDDESTNTKVYGVGTVGKATVRQIPKLVATLLHYEKDRDGRVWAYLLDHPDTENPAVLWKAKANLPAHQRIWDFVNWAKEWTGPDGTKIKFEKGGRFEITFDQTLYHYLKFQHWAKQAVAQDLKQRLEREEAERAKKNDEKVKTAAPD